jgi:hypothetical protein
MVQTKKHGKSKKHVKSKKHGKTNNIIIKPLSNEIFKPVAELFKYSHEQYKALIQLTFQFNTYYNRQLCEDYYHHNIIERTFNLDMMNFLTFNEWRFNPDSKEQKYIGFSYTHLIIADYHAKLKPSKTLIMNCLSGFFYNLNIDNKFEADAVILFEPNYTGRIASSKLEKYKSLTMFKNLYGGHDLTSSIEYISTIRNLQTTISKYDFIFINVNVIRAFNNLSFAYLLRLPVLFAAISTALKQLEKGGTLIITYKLVYQIPFITKLIQLLDVAFDSISFEDDNTAMMDMPGSEEGNIGFIVCKKYGVLSSMVIDKLLDLSIEHLEMANWDVCDIAYFYNKWCLEHPKDSPLFYNISNPIALSDIKDPHEYRTYSKSINILYDLELDILNKSEPSLRAYLITSKFYTNFINHFEKCNYMIVQYINKISDKEGDIYKLDEKIYEIEFYKRLSNIISVLEHYKLPYNKNILEYLTQIQNDISHRFYTLENPIFHTLIKYNDKVTKHLMLEAFNKLGRYSGYSIPLLSGYFDRIQMAYKTKELLLSNLGITYAPQNVRAAVNDFTRGITSYLAKHYKLPLRPSNAFTKLWEIYSTFDFLIPKNKATFHNFHICEAPGQWIITTKYFISKKRRNITEHDWRSNSLNPYNAENLVTYGNGIFADDYGLMKKNYGQWLWGADNTGDITRRRNVVWFREYMRKWIPASSKMDLIIGDGGLSTEEDAILLQRLDIGQMIMVATCSSIGGCCVMKHFTPYIKRHVNTYNASGFFISFMYMYYLMFDEVYLFKPYSSNPDSGEFYLIGKNFKGCSDIVLEKLLVYQDNFEMNVALFKLEDIPESFIHQVNGFLDVMSHYNASAIDKQIILLTCVKAESHQSVLINGINKDIRDKLKCDVFLNAEKLFEIQEPRYKKWITKYGFI